METQELDHLLVVLKFEDEWPARVAEFIADIANWLSAHPDLSEFSTSDIVNELESIAFEEGFIHDVCTSTFDTIGTGETVDTCNSVIDFEDFRRRMALAAFERYGLNKVA